MLKVILFMLLVFITLTGCGEKEIVITSEYVTNDYWDENARAIKINRMRLKPGNRISPKHLSQSIVLERLEEDSTFVYYANVKPNSKVYFNKDNGFVWRREWGSSSDTVRTVGDLKPGTWYKFSYLLTYPYYVYIFVDSANHVYRQDVNLANY